MAWQDLILGATGLVAAGDLPYGCRDIYAGNLEAVMTGRRGLSSENIEQELHGRILSHMDARVDGARALSAIAWSGYIAGLLEWGLIGIDAHARLQALLPNLVADPALAISRGVDDQGRPLVQ